MQQPDIRKRQPFLRVLSDEQLREIYKASLKILQEIGIQRYIVAGASVDSNSLGLEAIRRTKPGASHLTDDYTLDNLRGTVLSQASQPGAFRKLGGGRPNRSVQAAQSNRSGGLARHQVPPLSGGAEKKSAQFFTRGKPSR